MNIFITLDITFHIHYLSNLTTFDLGPVSSNKPSSFVLPSIMGKVNELFENYDFKGKCFLLCKHCDLNSSTIILFLTEFIKFYFWFMMQSQSLLFMEMIRVVCIQTRV